VDGMSVSANAKHLVAANGDGSVQSFSITGGALMPDCAPQDSQGFTDGNHGVPAGVDITANSQLAIFGDANRSATAIAELEIAQLPIACSTAPTKDFGGPHGANFTNLGPGVHGKNIWLSPNGKFIYVANNESKQITTIGNVPPYGLTLVPQSSCTAGYTNPTSLHTVGTTYVIPGEIQTSATAGTGTQLYVAEYGNPSEVALLNVDAFGCTQEVGGFTPSPYPDPQSNYTTQVFGSYSVNAWPPRPF
jgi:hypothetical protein